MMDLSYPFKYDTRQYWSNFDKVEENIKAAQDFIEYLNLLDIRSVILNLGNSLVEHEEININYQVIPASILYNLGLLQENLAIINIDPTFVFSDLIREYNTYVEDLVIIRETESILHMQKVINGYSLDLLFSKSLLPTYDYKSWGIIAEFVKSSNPYIKDIKELVYKYKTNDADKLFIEQYYKVIGDLCRKSIENNYTVIVVNYCILFNQRWKGIYFGMFKELLDTISLYPSIRVFEYTSFKINSLNYSCIELKVRYYTDKRMYKAVNTSLHTGIIDKYDNKINNCIITILEEGKIVFNYINNDFKEKINTLYN